MHYICGKYTLEMNIFIGRLSTKTTEKELYTLFKNYGFVDKCYIVRDKVGKCSRGYAYIIMNNTKEAELAINKLNNYELNGELMMVKPARKGEIRFITEF